MALVGLSGQKLLTEFLHTGGIRVMEEVNFPHLVPKVLLYNLSVYALALVALISKALNTIFVQMLMMKPMHKLQHGRGAWSFSHDQAVLFFGIESFSYDQAACPCEGHPKKRSGKQSPFTLLTCMPWPVGPQHSGSNIQVNKR